MMILRNHPIGVVYRCFELTCRTGSCYKTVAIARFPSSRRCWSGLLARDLTNVFAGGITNSSSLGPWIRSTGLVIGDFDGRRGASGELSYRAARWPLFGTSLLRGSLLSKSSRSS